MIDVARQHKANSEFAKLILRSGLKTEEFLLKLGIPEEKHKSARNWLYREAPVTYLEKARALVQDPLGVSPLKSTGFGKLKMLGTIGAGGNPDSRSMDESPIDVSIEFAHDDWGGFRVESNAVSMMPIIHPGDTVVMSPVNVVKLRKFMVVRMLDTPTEMYVKIAEYDQKLGQFYFASVNPQSPPIAADKVKIEGLVVGIISADYRIKLGPEIAGIDQNYIESLFRSRLP